MKQKVIISATLTGMLLTGNAYAIYVEPVDCVTCTDPFNPTECNSYDSTCCDPCKIGPIEPIKCTPSLCNGETVTDMGDGCDKIASSGCVNNICTTTYTARCQKGYYGAATLNNLKTSCTGCTACPSSGGIAGTTSGAGALAITECYLPSGSAFSDSTGSGTYTNNCYYQN
ncbi:MAG: hypothetical protein K2I81_03470 [Alphaproteobacteria bacterium]|nr:hypothetical protein [Alphaproteobacteria bacterium]